MSAMASPNAAVSSPLTMAPELSNATVMMPRSVRRKNSAAPKSLSSSRAMGRTVMSSAAPTMPPMSEET